MECEVLETYARYSYFVCSQLKKRKVPKLKHSNAEMASSSTSSAAVTSPFDALPDELVLKIIQMATWIPDE